LWGPFIWDILHWISFNFCIMDAEFKKLFLMYLPNLLPCKKCKENYLKHIHDEPPDFSSKNNFSRWLVKIHNKTNKMLKKPVVSYSKVERRYVTDFARMRARTSFVKWNDIMRNYINNSPVHTQRSYSKFISYIFNKF